MIEWVLLGLALFAAMLIWMKLNDDELEGFPWLALVIIIPWSFWHWRDTPEEAAAKDAKKAAELLVRQTPHVVREADGCKVYAFERGGRDHYFTRCPSTTDTETNWTESCGKNCTHHKSENIVTRNK